MLRDLQPQFAAYLGTPTRARGYPPFAGQHALIAVVAANEAERAAPGVTLVDVSIIGAAGRIYLAGPTADVRRAKIVMTDVPSAVAGREH